MRPLCYLNGAKSNAKEVIEAFAEGSGAEITTRLEYVPGRPAVFYGVDRLTIDLWRKVQSLKAPYWYIDNGYFLSKWQGGPYLRITKNAPQHSGLGDSDGARWKALGLKFKPWRVKGANQHVLVACQSEWWHERHGEPLDKWIERVKAELAKNCWRPVVIRQKPFKTKEQPLADQLKDCWAVVTHSSMVAADALMAGVPIFATDSANALRYMGRIMLALIEQPFYPENREQWGRVLADNQWTPKEIRSGMAWKALTAP